MELEYLKFANGIGMWIACIPAVVLVLFQAYIFYKKAWETGPKIGVTESMMKEAVRSSALASIGPSIVVVSGMISLLASVGGPLSWIRLSVIGSVMYELPAADRAATASGCQLGTNNMTLQAFANAAWLMTACCIGWILVAALFTDKMEGFRDKVAGGNMDAIVALTAGGGVGGFGYMCAQRIINAVPSNQVASVVGFAVSLIMNFIIKKSNAKWAQQFGMTISMFTGMAAGCLFL